MKLTTIIFLIAAVGAVLGGGLGYWFLSARTVSKDDWPPLNVSGVQWKATEIQQETLWDYSELDVTLMAERARESAAARLEITPALLQGLCSGFLTSLPEFGVQTPPDRLYLVRLSLLNPDGTPSPTLRAPVNVRGGACFLDMSNGRAFLRYPPPLQDWVLRRATFPEGAEAGHMDFYFSWVGDGKADLETFPFEAACQAILANPPFPNVDDFLAANASRKIGVAATRVVGNALLNLTKSRLLLFQSDGQTCGDLLEEIET
ncbi:MAG TPA: hypothetical protein ENK28_06185 [Aliiroseovarius sp.]|nr:hypothetical protein [Aliiroseovarius sp.]